MPVNTAVVGRQPIVDRHDEVVGYELLFRPLPDSDEARDPLTPRGFDGDEMTNQVIFSVLGLGIERLTGGRTVFCNADRGVLTGQVPVSLPPRQTVIEVLETVALDDEILAGCRALGRAGYRLAADDFSWMPRAEELLEIVDMVKIDLRRTPIDEIPSVIGRCRTFGVQLVAEKIETREELAVCRQLDFDLFQGFYLGRPTTVSGPAVGPTRLAVMRLAAAVLDDDIDYQTIDRLLRAEPALSYQLIQLAAIGRFGETKRGVRSVREALVWIGLNRLRGWIPALLLRPAGRAIDTNLPAVLSRARMAELLASELFPRDADFAFTAGMLSAFDILLGVPRENLALILDIPTDLQHAAFGSDTPVGRLIGDIIAYEQYGPGPVQFPDLDAATVSRAAAHAFSWAVQATQLIDSFAA